MAKEILDRVITIKPELLLHGSLTNTSDLIKSSIAESLLILFEEGTILLRDLYPLKNFIKINNPSMHELLRTYILDEVKSVDVRKLAIDIANVCKIESLENNILKIVDDVAQPLELRIHAASFISEIGSREAKGNLLSLAKGEAGDDPEDELKGYGLLSVWPDHIATPDLFAIITPVKRELYLGSYQRFLYSYLVYNLDTESLPIALQWINSIYEHETSSYIFENVADQIIIKASKHLDDPKILETFAYTALNRLSNYKPLARDRYENFLKSPFFNDPIQRLRLIEEMSKYHSEFKNKIYTLFRSEIPIVSSEDIPWLIDRLRESENGESIDYWIELIKYAFREDAIRYFEIIYEASQEIPKLKSSFLWVLGPIDLDSEIATDMREHYERQQKYLQRDERPPIDPSPYDTTLTFLSDFEKGDVDAWWKLNYIMMFNQDGSPATNHLNSDLSRFPVWALFKETTIYRMKKAAEDYIIKGDPNTEEWIGTNKIHYPAFSGYRAFSLLFKEDVQILANIPPEIWVKWAPILLTFPVNATQDMDIQRELLSIAYQYARDEIISRTLFLIDIENDKGDYLHILDTVQDLWDPSLRDALLGKVRDPTLKPTCMRKILELLLKNQTPEAEEYAKSLITVDEPEQEVDKEKRRLASSALIRYGHDAGWTRIWPIISGDTAFGRMTLEAVATSGFYGEFWKNISYEHLKSLITWLLKQYPASDDPVHNGIYSVGPRDQIARLRNNILSYIRIHGSIETCIIIEGLINEFPQYLGLKMMLNEAQKTMRMNTWVPPKPNDILRIVKDRNARFVQNGFQLVSLILESLERLEQRLQGEPSASEFLWNKINNTQYRPKDENSFSNYLKIHLDDDLKGKGIIVNREVEIRRGEKTDVHVDAVSSGERTRVIDVVNVIIEVKGCWHPNLKTAMETQLVGRYLKDNKCDYGIFLVGWYLCEKWDEDDYKKENCGRNSQEDLVTFLDEQSILISERDHKYVTSKIVNVTLR